MYKHHIARLAAVILMGLLAVIWIVKTVLDFEVNHLLLALVWSMAFLAQLKRYREG